MARLCNQAAIRLTDYIKRMRMNQSLVSKMLLFAICMLVLSSTHAQGESYQYDKQDSSWIMIVHAGGVISV